MSEEFDQEKLQALAAEIAKGIKSEADLASFSRQLVKATVESALNAELSEHLGYERHGRSDNNPGNSRNGYSSKTLKGEVGEVEVQTPRDRNGTFEPHLIKKGQTRFTEFDDQILALYAKGMSTRDIVAAFKEMYGAEVSATLISKVTDTVLETVQEWQARPLDGVYPIVYLDGIVVKVRHDKRVINKAIYLALGVNLDGQKELLGLWIGESEGAKFWLGVLTELKNRGLEDILIACTDGLTGFPEAIESLYPKARIQLCIVHMVRNSLRYVSWKDRKAVAHDLRQVYRSSTVEEAERELEAFASVWDEKYPSISRAWRRHWPHLITLFDYPDEIRKIIYTTNAIESLNSVIRKAVRNRKIFPTDNSAMKVVYLATQAAAERWTRPVRDWKSALNRFVIEFEDRIPAM